MNRTATQTYKHVSDQGKRDQLVLENLTYVRHILGKLVGGLPTGVDVENLESAGVLGLVEAAQQFDESRGVVFRTFAYRRIRGAIIDELRRNCPLPQHVLQSVARLRRAMERLEPPVTSEELARESGMTVAEVEECLEALRLTRTSEWDDSIDSAAANRSAEARRPESSLEDSESMAVLIDCIEALPQQERLVVTLYHLEDLRLKEIGRLLSLSESRVSRILNGAEAKLRNAVEKHGG